MTAHGRALKAADDGSLNLKDTNKRFLEALKKEVATHLLLSLTCVDAESLEGLPDRAF